MGTMQMTLANTTRTLPTATMPNLEPHLEPGFVPGRTSLLTGYSNPLSSTHKASSRLVFTGL